MLLLDQSVPQSPLLLGLLFVLLLLRSGAADTQSQVLNTGVHDWIVPTSSRKLMFTVAIEAFQVSIGRAILVLAGKWCTT